MVQTVARYARYAVTTVWVVVGAWLLWSTSATVRAALLVVPRPPEILKEVIVRNVPDEQGHKASFRIMLFSDEFRWRINSYSALDGGTRPQFTPEMKAVLNSAKEVICVSAS